MRTKVAKTLKVIGFFVVGLLMMQSCDKEIEQVGLDLVDNTIFTANSYLSGVHSSSEKIEHVPSNNIGQYLLGVYSDNEFGTLKGAIATTLALPAVGEAYSFGEESVIDSVLISIPYQFTREDDLEDGKPKFSIDSVFGNTDTEFNIKVFELKTFLNSLDPNDPSKNAVYYSDKEFQVGSQALFDGPFRINPNDTVTYINRKAADGITYYDRDTLMSEDLGPRLKIPLDNELVKQLLVDPAGGPDFDNFDAFARYFRGLYIQADVFSDRNSHLISLDLSGSKMTIYFSQTSDEEEGEDLNANGVNGEENVRVKSTFEYLFGNIKSNVLTRDYSIEKQSGEDRLYVQGAAGSLAKIDLFAGQDLDELRNNNWLITGATLSFYVDQSSSSNIVPERLLLYLYEDNLHVIDMLSEGPSVVGGTLERDEDGRPFRYVFRITDYISQVLDLEDPLELQPLALKVFNPSDEPSSPTDFNVKKFNWNPQGVVLFDHRSSAADKRVQLEIFYSELNN